MYAATDAGASRQKQRNVASVVRPLGVTASREEDSLHTFCYIPPCLRMCETRDSNVDESPKSSSLLNRVYPVFERTELNIPLKTHGNRECYIT